MEGLLSKESLYIGAITAGITLLLIIFVGLFSGVSLGLILLRGILFSVLLFLLGTALGILLQKFVPDIWDESGRSSESDDESASYQPPAGLDVMVGADDDPRPSGGGYSPGVSLHETEKLDEAMQPAPKTTGRKRSEVVGNYRIVEDKSSPNDPEQYAKAVRTMLKKDD